VISLSAVLLHQSEALDQLPQMRASLRSRKLLADATAVSDETDAVT
jgi:hypothetical protein